MMLRRIAVVVTLVAGSYAIAESQELATHYYAEKSTNSVGEPIFVSAELMNISPQSVRFNDGACSQSFIPFFSPSPRKITKLYGCWGGGIGGD